MYLYTIKQQQKTNTMTKQANNDRRARVEEAKREMSKVNFYKIALEVLAENPHLDIQSDEFAQIAAAKM